MLRVTAARALAAAGWSFATMQFAGAAAPMRAQSAPPARRASSSERRTEHDTAATEAERRWRARIELRRENSARGRPEESTKSLVRIETFVGGFVETVRLDFAIPDERQDFNGSILRPRVGDIASRLRFRSFVAPGYRVSTFVEATLPTARPPELGGGRYRLSASVRVEAPIQLPLLDGSLHESRVELEAEGVNSVGGDPSRRRFSYTRFDVSAHQVWRRTYTSSLRLRPVVDWEANGRTGAIARVEVGRSFGHDWRAWVMVGRRVWGASDIATTYSTRVGLGVVRTFF